MLAGYWILLFPGKISEKDVEELAYLCSGYDQNLVIIRERELKTSGQKSKCVDPNKKGMVSTTKYVGGIEKDR